jgi:preprotein translocase subunit SecG
MTKKTIKTIVLIVAFIALFIALVVRANNTPSKDTNKSETI